MAERASTKTLKGKGADRADRHTHEFSRQAIASGPQADVLALQRAAGNQAVSQFLHSQLGNTQPTGGIIQRHWLPCDSAEDPSLKCDEEGEKPRREDQDLEGIQTKLTISQPGDRYEREADDIADMVMRMPDNAFYAISTAPATIQRECAACEGGKGLCPKCHEEEQISRSPASRGFLPLQRQADISRKGKAETSDQAPAVPGQVAASIRGMRGQGRALPQATRSFFEQRFGYDFSGVRVHVGEWAANAARGLQARAFTIGQDVVFGAGQYAPETSEGKRLLAHELTHILQQNWRSSLDAESAEMIPGHADCHVARKLQTAPPSMIQCDKIDHRQLTWDDFQGEVPKKAKHEAATVSDFHKPELKNLAPANVTAEDTGEECKVGKKKLTKFKASVGIDPDEIKVKAYMWQEKSWKKPWTTEKEARENKCKKGLVKDCEAHFGKEFKKVAKQRTQRVKECEKHFGKSLKQATKDCKEQEKACKKSFDDNQGPPFEITVGDTTIAANSKQECTSVLLSECTSEMMKGVSFSSEVEGETAEATTKAECSADFAKSLEELLKAQVKWTGKMAGEEAEVTSREECSKSFLEECAGRLSEAASNALLKHEQAHFDIANVMADKTQDALRTLAGTFDKEVTACGKEAAIKKAKAEAQKQIKKLQQKYDSGRTEMTKKQAQYDKQTNHGRIEEKQIEWEEKIAEGFPD